MPQFVTIIKIIPTYDGKTLYSRAVSSINIIESTTNTYYRKRNNPAFLVRLGPPNEFFLKKILSCLGEKYYIYRITFGSAHSLLDKLEKRKLDIGELYCS